MRDNSVDIVVSSLSLHHWAEPEQALAEIFRVLKPNGRLLIFDLRRDSPRIVYIIFVLGQELFTPEAIRRTNGAVGSLWASYTSGELVALLSKGRFKHVKVSSMPAWLVGHAVKTGQG